MSDVAATVHAIAVAEQFAPGRRPARIESLGSGHIHDTLRACYEDASGDLVLQRMNEYVFPENIYEPQKMERLFQLIKKCCFQGHTHVPGVFTLKEFFSPVDIDHEYRITDQKLMINVGSVGQPRDLDSRSCYVIVHDGLIQFRRVEYPFEETAAKIERITALDDHFGNRLRDGR